MSKYMRTALLVAVGVLCVASAAFASLPDPNHITCPTYVVFSPSGFITFTVNVKDQTGANIAGSPVNVNFGALPVVWCANQAAGVSRSGNVLTATTNANGNALFPIRAGKSPSASCTGLAISITASGVPICSISKASTPDFDGNLLVNVQDLGTFAADEGSGNNCGDFDGNNLVNVQDLGVFAAGEAAGGCP